MTKTIKVTIIMILPLLAISLYISNLFVAKDLPSAVQGRLNLSPWDFRQDGPVTLAGEWECYDGQLLTPEDFSEASNSKPKLTGYSKLTAGRSESSEPKTLDPKGIRTYRLIIEIRSSEDGFGMIVDNIRMSNRLYINGSLEGSCGNPAEKDHGYEPKNAAYNSYFDVSGDEIEILLQTANFNYPFGNNNSYTLIFGNQKDIDFQKTGAAAADLTGAAMSFLFGVYYLYIFLTGKGKNREVLYSSTQFFSLAILLLFTGQKLIYGFVSDIPFELFCKLQLLSLIGVPASTVAYTNYINKWVIPNFLMRIIFVIFSVYTLILILFNYEISSYLNGFIYVFICMIYLYIIIKLFMAHRLVAPDTILRKEILLYLMCTVCLFAAFLNNFLHNLTWTSTRITGTAGFYGFILLSLIILAFRFSANYDNMVKLDKVKDEFIVKTSYELKAPLNSIADISEHLIKEHSEGILSIENCAENAALTKNIVQRLLNIVNTSLDVNLLNNDQLKPQISSVDIKVCVDLAIESARGFMTDKKIEISSELTESLFAETDENRVRQVLWNLILNSVKSMEQGKIWIRGKREKGMVSISVEDNGCGIPEDKWEEIFQPYITLKSQGIGLGLYVTRQLVRLMHGNIYVEWSELNQGTRFVLLLPGSAVKNNVGSETEKKVSPPVQRRERLTENRFRINKKDTEQNFKNTVLVVDDEIFNLKTAAHILSSEGYRVLTARTGEDMLQTVQSQQVDLIILDVMLPGESGISVCKKIRETYSLIELPILISMVSARNHDINLGLEAGANDFILKPFQGAEVKARVKTLIELKKSIDEAMKSELAFLHAQIKPHFLYNAINTMVSFCYTDSEKAAKLLTDFSKYLRLIFDVDHKHMMIPLRREIEMIDAYAAIEQARFGDKIKVRYDIDPELINLKIPPLCIQPLVENSIKHGLCKKQEGGTVFISVKKNESELRIEVRDTGVGMTEEKLNSLKRMEDGNEGIGFSNISKRMKKWKQAQIEIQSVLEQGTTVAMTIRQDR